MYECDMTGNGPIWKGKKPSKQQCQDISDLQELMESEGRSPSRSDVLRLLHGEWPAMEFRLKQYQEFKRGRR